MDVSNWIEFWARFAPDRAAISWEGRKIGYGALRGLVRRLAVVLADGLDVRAGARVAYLGYNSPDLVALLFACARTGAVLVPLNWRLAVPELAYALADSGCELLVFEPRFAESAAAAVSDLPDCRAVDTTRLDDLMSQARAQPPGRGPGLEAPLVLAYTSGTTSRPKGAVLTQAAVAFNAANAIAAYDMTRRDRVLTNLPMFHVGGLNIHTTPAFCAGAEVVLQPRFEPDAALAALAGERPNLMILVPALMRAVVDHPIWPTSISPACDASRPVRPSCRGRCSTPISTAAFPWSRSTAPPRPPRSRSTKGSRTPGAARDPPASRRSIATPGSWTPMERTFRRAGAERSWCAAPTS